MKQFDINRFDELIQFGYTYFGMYPIKSITEVNYFIRNYTNVEFYLLYPDDSEGQIHPKDLLENFKAYYGNGYIPAIQIADFYPQLNNNDWESIDTVKSFITDMNNQGELNMNNSQLRQNIQTNANKTYTENGDKAYLTTLNANLDFFALASSLRNNGYTRLKELKELLDKATVEDLNLAIKNIFFLRDVRNGNKERDLGRFALTYLSNNRPDTFNKIIEFIPVIGRFDDLSYVLSVTKQESVKKEIAHFILLQLESDNQSENPSLLAKWLPTTDAGKKTRSQAKILTSLLQKYFDVHPFAYHRMVKNIRKKLDLLETKITEEKFEQIDYSKVAGQAMLKNKAVFAKKDQERFNAYQESLNKGEVKAKTDTITPVQLVEQLVNKVSYGLHLNPMLTEKEKQFINNQWRDLERNLTDKNIIVVRDGSGSMSGTPMNTASALAIYASECLTGTFKNSFITFSSRPEFVEFPDFAKTLSDKLTFLSAYNDISNTDIEKVYNLILKSSIGIPEKDQIDTVVIVSDMEFDCISHDADESTYEQAKRQFENHGIKFPHVVFWNVDARHTHYPATNNDDVSLVSGYSSEIFKEIIKNEVKTPSKRMLQTLSRYDYLDNILS